MTPFTRESCPKNALWMHVGGSLWNTVASYCPDGITLNTGDFKSWKHLAYNWRYSIDGGVTFHPAHQP